MSDSPEETNYYLRFISMYIDLCTECVCKVFLHVIPDKDTASFFRTNCKLFYDLEKRKVFSHKEILFIVSPSPKPEAFDISLLIKLLCNTKTTLSPPLKGWESQPDPSDLSISADLLRLRRIRNVIIGHRPRAKLPKYKFERLWGETESILLRITKETYSGAETALSERLERYKKMPLHANQEMENQYLSKLQEWWQTCEEVSGLQVKMETLVQKTQEFVLFFKTRPKHYCRYVRLLFEGGKSVLLGIMKKELSSKRLDIGNVLLQSACQLKTALMDEEMRSQVFPNATAPNIDCNSWDILTLATVVLFIFRSDLSEEVLGEIEVIADAITNYAQTAIKSLDSMKFQFCCEDLVSSIKTLSTFVGGETRQDCKTHIERYRNIDGSDVEVDHYLDQMKLHAHDIRTISDIYKETLTNLKGCVKEMIEEGVVFENDKDLELKMVTLGENKEKKNLAEEILETVWQSALKMSDSPEEFASVRYEVDRILEQVKSISGVKTTKVEKGCIILTIRYSSWSGLYTILEYIESCRFHESLENISSELGDVCGEVVMMQGNLTMESLQNVMPNHDQYSFKRNGGISVPISCSSVESMREVFALLVSDETAQHFRNIGDALSRHVGEHISVHAYPGVNGFTGLFENEEKPYAECSDQPSYSIQPSEAKDLLLKGRVIGDECMHLYDGIARAITQQSEVTFADFDPTLQKEESDKLALFEPKYIRTEVVKLLTEHSKQFSSVISLLEELPFEQLSSKSGEFENQQITGKYYESVLSEIVSSQDCQTFLSLRLYAAATCLNIPVYILCRNELGYLQWLYFPPLFEFESQPRTLLNYITMYSSSKSEFFVIKSQKFVPEPNAYGLLGMYLTVLDDTPVESIDVPKTLLAITKTHKERLCCSVDKSIMEECWNMLSERGFNLEPGIPEQTEFCPLITNSDDAFTIVCQVLIKRREFQMLAAYISDFEAFVNESKYLGCHLKVCELDKATVERNFEVANFVNECKDIELELHKRSKILSSAQFASSSFGLAAVGIILAPFSFGASLGLSLAGGAIGAMTAATTGSVKMIRLNKIVKEINEKKFVLKAKEQEISEKLRATKDLFEYANLIVSNVKQQDAGVRKGVGSEGTSVLKVSDTPLMAAKISTTSSSASASIVGGLSLALDIKFLAEALRNKLQGHTRDANEILQSTAETVDCKHRVFNSIVRGNFEDSDRLVTLDHSNAKNEI